MSSYKLKPSHKKTRQKTLRMSEEHLNMITTKALLYCDGDFTRWMTYAALNYVPSGEEIEMEVKVVPKRRSKK